MPGSRVRVPPFPPTLFKDLHITLPTLERFSREFRVSLLSLLSAEDYDAELAERYGWVNRTLPAAELGGFVRTLAHRIASFPAGGHAAIKEQVNAIALAPGEDFRRDADLYYAGVQGPQIRDRLSAALRRGFQTREAELTLPRMLGELDH
jgi:enoyl-CoA hydratase/carnithine racemase